MHKYLSSEENSIIKKIKLLQTKKYRIKNKQFLIEGVRIVEEAIVHNAPIDCILYSNKLLEVQGGKILLEKISDRYMAYNVEERLLEKLMQTENPQGVLAIINMMDTQIQKDFFEKNRFFVVLDRIQDPGNMGTIIRTAEAANVDAIFLTKGCVDIYNSKTIRATMGAIFHIPILQCDDEWIDVLKRNNVKLIATDLNTSKNYNDINYHENIAIIIGNEANGIENTLLKKVDEIVKIPILGKIESLNASVSAGILIYRALQDQIPRN